MRGNEVISWRVLTGMLAVGVVCGSAFTFTKLLADEMTSVALVQGRLTTAALAVLVVMAFRRAPAGLTLTLVGRVTVLALLDGIIPYLLVAWAAGRVDASVAGVLLSTMPLFTAALATVALPDERLALTGAFGIGTGIVGVAVLAGPSALDVTNNSAVGLLAVVAAAASFGAGTVYARILLRHGDPVTLTGLKLAMAAVLLAPVTVAGGGAATFISLSPEGWVFLAILGFGSTGLARCVYVWVIQTAGSIRASLVTYVIPVVGVLLGWAVLGETIGADVLGGGALIVAGVASVMYGPRLQLARLNPTRLLSGRLGGAALAVSSERA